MPEGIRGGGTSRTSFLRATGVAIFAAIPAAKALISPRFARASADVYECQYVTCSYTYGHCCSGNLFYDRYACYDNFFNHDFCYDVCIYNPNKICNV